MAKKEENNPMKDQKKTKKQNKKHQEKSDNSTQLHHIKASEVSVKRSKEFYVSWLNELFNRTFPAFSKLSEYEKDSFDMVFEGFLADGTPVWNPDFGVRSCKIRNNCKRNKLQSDMMNWCPYCGDKFLDAADEEDLMDT